MKDYCNNNLDGAINFTNICVSCCLPSYCYFIAIHYSFLLQPGSSIPKVELCIVKVENTTSTPQKWVVKPPNTLDGMYVGTFIFA